MTDSIFIRPGIVSGKISAYPSKSYIQRVLILGLLNKNGVEIENYGASDDSEAVMEAVISLGAEVSLRNHILAVKGPVEFKHSEIFCNESGLCLRLFAPILALSEKEFSIRASKSLLNRGNEHINDILEKLGVRCVSEKDKLKVQGPLKSGRISIKDPMGSQLISGLLFALSKVKGDSLIEVINPVSFPYIEMTARLLNSFGANIRMESKKQILIKGGCDLKPGRIIIEGDWSSAAFLFVAGAITGEVTVTGLDPQSVQADKEILKYLRNAGVLLKIDKGSIKVSKSGLREFAADIKDCPDLFIPLVILGLNCEGETKLYNYKRLKYKESDRPYTLVSELKRAGARIEVRNDHIVISKSVLKYAELDTYNDHRLAMGFAVAALNSKEGLMIKYPSCVNKSYPSFFDSLKSITENKK